MNHQNRIRRYRLNCPDTKTIEEILLNAHRHPVVFQSFQHHVLVCRKCELAVKRIQRFYEILDKEISKPASPRVVDFVHTLTSKVQS